MKVLYFDCSSGISGDMVLGALVDLGIDRDFVREEIRKLNIPGFEIIFDKKLEKGVLGTDIKVLVNEKYDKYINAVRLKEHIVLHPVDNASEEEPEDCTFLECRDIKGLEQFIDASDLDLTVKIFCKKVMREIIKTEAYINNIQEKELKFNEMSLAETLVFITGTAVCTKALGIKKIFASPLHDGSGFLDYKNSSLPIPVPSVAEILKENGIPIVYKNVNTELITPTGLGIIKNLTADYGKMPAIKIDRTGYGHGKGEPGRLNALRIVMGDLFDEDNLMEDLYQLRRIREKVGTELF